MEMTRRGKDRILQLPFWANVNKYECLEARKQRSCREFVPATGRDTPHDNKSVTSELEAGWADNCLHANFWI